MGYCKWILIDLIWTSIDVKIGSPTFHTWGLRSNHQNYNIHTHFPIIARLEMDNNWTIRTVWLSLRNYIFRNSKNEFSRSDFNFCLLDMSGFVRTFRISMWKTPNEQEDIWVWHNTCTFENFILSYWPIAQHWACGKAHWQDENITLAL